MSPVSLAELEALYRRRFGRLVRVAAAVTRDEAAAAEAVQEAFARVIRARDSFRGDAPLEAWVWRVVVNEAKRSSGQVHVDEPRSDQVSPNGSVAHDLALRHLIGALPERQRLAIFLRYYADLDYRTIAAVLEVEVGTVSATLHAAHAALRDAIEGVRA